MKVWIKFFDVEMQVKSNGIELEVRSPDDKHQIGVFCHNDWTSVV